MFSIFHPSVLTTWWTLGTVISTFVFTTWWTLGTVISTSVFYKLSEESYIRHGKLDSSICLLFYVLYQYATWWLVILGFTILCYLDSTSNTIAQPIKLWQGQWYSHPLWHQWSLLFFAFSIRHSSSICSYTHHPFLFLIVEPIGFREDTLIPIIWNFNTTSCCLYLLIWHDVIL